MTVVLPPRHIAKWSTPTTHRDDPSPLYDCGPHVLHEASMDQAVVTQDGRMLEARSGVCLLIAVYVSKLKLGAVIHLWRGEGCGIAAEGAGQVRGKLRTQRGAPGSVLRIQQDHDAGTPVMIGGRRVVETQHFRP